MTIFTEHRVRTPGYLEEYTSPLGDVLSTTAGEAFDFNPVNSIMRMRELSRAERGVGPNILDYNLFGDQAPSTASEMTDAATARQRITDEGLDLQVPDDGIRERALEILIERKKEERRRQDILSRGPGGFGAGVARFGTGLAVSALDPLNIASAFVPVVSGARYATMLGRASGPLGRTGVRAGIGAAEGTAGAALVEPLVYGAARQQQADYDLSDSLLNLAFGTTLGGGLHVGLGAVGIGPDWRTARADPAAPIPRMMESVDAGTREAALRAGVAQAVSGRAIDVEPVVSYAGRQGFEQPLRASVGPAETISPQIDPTIGIEGFTVYHGSPHQFDKFSMDRIGTGQGAQAYGHGLYMAEARGVADEYAKEVLDKDYFDSVNARLSVLAREMTKYEVPGQYGKYRDQKGYDLRTEYDRLMDERAGKKGNLYEVRIRANPDDFLDWDKPLSEQPSSVRRVVDEILGMEGGTLAKKKLGPEATGQQIWEALRSPFTAKALGFENFSTSGPSNALAQRGIPGIRYLDQGSRVDPKELQTWQAAVALYELADDAASQKKLATARARLADLERRQAEGSRNFVVFDDSLLTTVRRNDEFLAPQPKDIQAKAAASFAPEAMRLYDGEAIRIADERIATAVDDEAMPETSLAEVMEDVQRMVTAMDTPGTVAPPRIKVKGQDWLVEGIERARDLSDKLGLTTEIDRLAYEGNTAAQIVNKLKGKLPKDDEKQFVVQVRASLGIPSQDQFAEFLEWRKSYEARAKGAGGQLSQQVAAELGEFDELAQVAEAYGRGVKAAADCRLSRGA